jgi:hypothetical protein
MVNAPVRSQDVDALVSGVVPFPDRHRLRFPAGAGNDASVDFHSRPREGSDPDGEKKERMSPHSLILRHLASPRAKACPRTARSLRRRKAF